jgi:site-specific recombinase XerD
LRGIKSDIEDEWIGAFRRDLRARDCSPATIKSYSHDVQLFLQWHTTVKGTVSPEKIIGFDLMIYRKHLLKEKKYKGSTINRKIQALRQFFRWAHQSGLIPTEISREVRFVRAAKRYRPAHLNRREINALLRAAGTPRSFLGKRNFAIIQLFLQTGIRVAELAGLTISDLTVSERRGSLRIREGKGGREREIPLNKAARLAITAHSQTFKESPAPDTPLFGSERGTPLSVRSVQHLVARTAKHAGIDRIPVCAHTLRHTFAMNYLSANPGKLVELANLLGHTSLDTTAIYLQPSAEDLAEGMERMSSDDDS